MTQRSLPETITVGRVRRAHGLRGELLVEPMSDVTGRFAPGATFTLVKPGQPARRVTVERARPQGDALLIACREIADRDEAERWQNGWCEVQRSEVPALPEGEYYHFELIGCRCRDRQAGDLGEVLEILEDGGGLLLLVRSVDGELLIPFVADFLERVDIEGGCIELSLPPGLVETCRST